MKRAKSPFWLREPNEQKARFRKKGGQKVHFKTPKYMYIPIGRKKTSKKSTLKKKRRAKSPLSKSKRRAKSPFEEKRRATSPLSNRQIHVNSHRAKKDEQKVRFGKKDEQKVRFRKNDVQKVHFRKNKLPSKCRFRAKDDKNCQFFKLTRHEAHRQVTIERVKLIEGATVFKWSNTRAIDLLWTPTYRRCYE